MKNLSNSLFKKFESNKIMNLAKIIGGEVIGTQYAMPNGPSGYDVYDSSTAGPIEGSTPSDFVFFSQR